MGTDELLALTREYSAHGLSALDWGVQQDVTRWTAGVGACGWSAHRLGSFLQNYKRIPWAKNKGMTEEMHFRFNTALWLFGLVTVTGGALNVIADIKDLGLYHTAYKPLHALLSFATAGLIVWNYGEMIWRGFKQQKIDRLWGRLKYAHEITSSRGINTLELLAIPIAFIFPWVCAIRTAQNLIAAN